MARAGACWWASSLTEQDTCCSTSAPRNSTGKYGRLTYALLPHVNIAAWMLDCSFRSLSAFLFPLRFCSIPGFLHQHLQVLMKWREQVGRASTPFPRPLLVVQACGTVKPWDGAVAASLPGLGKAAKPHRAGFKECLPGRCSLSQRQRQPRGINKRIMQREAEIVGVGT